jgi:hypothetical protein
VRAAGIRLALSSLINARPSRPCADDPDLERLPEMNPHAMSDQTTDTIERALARLNKMFEGIVGSKLEFLSCDDLLDREKTQMWKDADIALVMTSQVRDFTFVESNASGTYGFPVWMDTDFLGLAIVKNVTNVSGAKLLVMAELVGLFIEQSLRQGDRREKLILLEERMRVLENAPNVIQLRPRKKLKDTMDLDNFIDEVEISTPAKSPSPISSLPLLLETKSASLLHRIAVELHQIAGRWALVASDDLPADIFNSKESLQELGNMTLFVRDIAKLTTNQQIKLAEYLSLGHQADAPQIIAGTSAPIASLLSEGKVLAHLVNLLTYAELKWTDKSNEQITRELVDATIAHLSREIRLEPRVGNHYIPFHPRYFNPDETLSH